MTEGFDSPEDIAVQKVVEQARETIVKSARNQGITDDVIEGVLERDFPKVQKIIEEVRIVEPLDPEELSKLATILHTSYSSHDMQTSAILSWVAEVKPGSTNSEKSEPEAPTAKIYDFAKYAQRKKDER